MKDHAIHFDVIDENFEFNLVELCECCTVQEETIIAMVAEGMLSPTGSSQTEWRFNGTSQRLVEITLHLQQDLRVNLPGAALALELMEEIRILRNQLQRKG